MTSTSRMAALIAEAVGVRHVMTTADLCDLIAPLKFFWLDVFAGDEVVQKEVLTELGLDAPEVLWALRFGQVPRMAIGQHGVRVVTWLAEPAGTIIEVHLLCVRRCIVPNDPHVMAEKASIFQAQSNLQEAARLLSGVNEQIPRYPFSIKIIQLRLERNYGEAVRLLQAQLAQFHYDSDLGKADDQVTLALMQRLAGDTADAKITAEQARNTLEQLYRNQPDAAFIIVALSQAYALMGQKDLAVQLAERAITLLPRTKDAVWGPAFEENLAFIQTTIGQNSRVISTLTQLLQTPYGSSDFYGTPVTAALLRLDPLWDPLRSDPRFQKLCDEKHP